MKDIILDAYVLEDLACLFGYGVKYFPSKLAVKEGKYTLNFDELEGLSINLANKLSNLQVKNNDRIVVLSEKRIEMAVVASSIWKVGGVYVPLDAELPADRLEDLIESLSPKIVICSNRIFSKVSQKLANLDVLFFEEILTDNESKLPQYDKVSKNKNDIAYIIFTSGSTGKPKGVMISHGSLLDYFVNHNEIFNFNPESYCFSITPCHFDVSIEDTLLPLSRASSVYLYKGIPIASKMLKILTEEKITHAIMVSTILSILTKIEHKILESDLSNLKLLMTGAEVCSVDIINFWKSSFPSLQVYNAYGPTETTIVSHCYEIENPEFDRVQSYPIGKSLRNVYSILIDEQNNIIKETNKKGELLIGGTQVMLGYWNQPSETDKVIFTIDEVTYYRTGDFCFRDDNDDYQFVGRSDSEIKLNGRRINLNEIEFELIKISEVEDASIGIIPSEFGNVLTAILIVNKNVDKQRLIEIDAHLQNKLPAYMIPSYFGVSNEKILSSTGKNNKKKINELLENSIKSNNNFNKYYQLENDVFTVI